MWRKDGHQPVKYEEWWKEPNEEERKKLLKLSSCISIEKDL